jgi:hypothetical protein
MSSRKIKPDVNTSTPNKKTRRKINIKPDEPRILDTIVDKISVLNPFNASTNEPQSQPQAQAQPVTNHEYSCEDKKRCPSGYRCDKHNKCYRLTDIDLVSNDKTAILTIDGNRNKTYDIDLLNKNIDRIIFLKRGRINDKPITGAVLKSIITDLKSKYTTAVGNSTYYGTLNDELIIQIIYLENIETMQPEKKDVVEKIPTVASPSPLIPSPDPNTKDDLQEIEPDIENKPMEVLDNLDDSHYDLPDYSSQIDIPENQQKIQDKIGVAPTNIVSKEHNNFLHKKELAHRENIALDDNYDFLYPEIDDPNFNIKIAKRKEFNDTQYDGKIYDIQKQAEKMCNAEFELMPHQLFVKNFLSFQTPYNSLLLYHGLGTGKTCSAIGIAEEMRDYMKQTGITQRIMVIASPNVQNNFRLQLFDERKLKLEGGIWNLNTCIGNTLLQEINPSQIQNVPKSKVVSQINTIISQYYVFMGYGELANYIKRKTHVDANTNLSSKQQKQQEISLIRSLFNNRLVIIDEVHNIRVMQENKEAKKTASLLMQCCKYADNIRLLLLSATPIFNNQREIIWLTNLLNVVDKRSLIEESDVFTNEDTMVEAKTLEDGTVIEGGEELLRRKLTGYISYVRGENPYTFPYRIYPNDFSVGRMIQYDNYPSTQMNTKPIDDKPSKTPLYIDLLGEYQNNAYQFILKHLLQTSVSITDAYGNVKEMPSFDNMESFGFKYLREPLQALNIIFPNTEFVAPPTSLQNENEDDTVAKPVDLETTQTNKRIINNMIGKTGLSNVVSYETTTTPFELRHNFKYKPETFEKFGNIFHPDNIETYSGKISSICKSIENSTGIIMIYSQFIDGGVVPIALALEEMGFTRYGFASHTKSLFADPPTKQVDATTLKPIDEMEESDKTNYRPAKYVMITGDKSFSPNNLADLKYITSPENKNGELVRVVLITKAAAEGLDFKNIRQLHMLEPWYNMNRIEQIIGRGVRNLSHCMLPFEERNVEIYLHATNTVDDTEPADLYVYRYAEKKAIQIGKITRILKETAIDCILNIGQTELTVEKLNTLAENQTIKLKLSSNQEIDYKIGDKSGSSICDYMNCDFVCSPNTEITKEDINKTTYDEHYVKMNYLGISKRIRDLFKEQPFYKREQLIASIQIANPYPDEQIDYVLSMFIENQYNYIIDKYGRKGTLINAGEYYGYQPIEISDNHSSILDRSVPVDFKPSEMYMELPVEKINDGIKTPLKVIEKQSSPTLVVRKIQKPVELLLKNLDYSLTVVQDEKTNFSKNILMDTAESDWYKHLGYIYNELHDNINISPDLIDKYTIYHWLDTQDIEDKLTILFHLYEIENSKMIDVLAKDIDIVHNDKIAKYVTSYFDEKIMIKDDINGFKRGIALASAKHIDLYVQVQETRNWKKASLTVSRSFTDQLRSKYYTPKEKIQDFIGFMHLFKKNTIEFKLKDIASKSSNNKGFKCNVMGKNEIIKFLNNKVLAKNPYPIREDKGGHITYDVNNNAKNIMRKGICVMLEMIMRYFNESPHTENKMWFFDVEQTLANDLPKL